MPLENNVIIIITIWFSAFVPDEAVRLVLKERGMRLIDLFALLQTEFILFNKAVIKEVHL